MHTISRDSPCYYLTSVANNRLPVFQSDELKLITCQALNDARRSGGFAIYAYVIMPDHLHLLITPTMVTLERSMQLIKGGFSHRLGSTLPVWQRGFTDHRIRDTADFLTRLQYIHRNPVEARLCEQAEAYAFSSANAKIRTEEYLSG